MNNTTMQDDAADSASMEERTTAVTAIELLFDLVFVAAIGQLATTLHDHVTWRGGL
ncbi:MAG: low temperature requirement protein A, partial [Cutibacterium avidum]|nr:low temperature requirement protein A [Cutibacterium avidum]